MHRNLAFAFAFACCWAGVPARAEETLGARFLMLGGQLHGSRCDGSPALRVALGDAYAELATRVHARRDARLNAVEATVRAQRLAPAGGGGALRVTRVVAVGPVVECNVSGGHRPLSGTRCTQPREPEDQGEAGDAGRGGRLSFQLSAQGGLAGGDGCNSFSGSAEAAADGRSFVVHRVMHTLVACPPPRVPAPVLGPGRHQVRIDGRRLTLLPGGHLLVADDNPP